MLLSEIFLFENKWDDAARKYQNFEEELLFLKNSGVSPGFIPWVVKHITSQSELWKNETNWESFKDSLLEFEKLSKAGKIPKEKRDINKISGEYEFYTVLQNAEEVISNADIKKQAKTQVETLYNDDKYLIIRPLSAAASIAYGKGTQWCVSAKKDNAFEQFPAGSMFFLINKINDIKYAFVVQNDKLEIYDEEDAALDTEQIEQLKKQLPDEIRNVIKREIQKLSSTAYFGSSTDEEIKLNPTFALEFPTTINYSKLENRLDIMSHILNNIDLNA